MAEHGLPVVSFASPSNFAVPAWLAQHAHPDYAFQEVMHRTGTEVSWVHFHGTLPLLIFGRDLGACHIFVGHPSVSGQHAAVMWNRTDGKCYIRDLESSSGTFINKSVIQHSVPVELRPDTEVRFGHSASAYIFRKLPGKGDPLSPMPPPGVTPPGGPHGPPPPRMMPPPPGPSRGPPPYEGRDRPAEAPARMVSPDRRNDRRDRSLHPPPRDGRFDGPPPEERRGGPHFDRRPRDYDGPRDYDRGPPPDRNPDRRGPPRGRYDNGHGPRGHRGGMSPRGRPRGPDDRISPRGRGRGSGYGQGRGNRYDDESYRRW